MSRTPIPTSRDHAELAKLHAECLEIEARTRRDGAPVARAAALLGTAGATFAALASLATVLLGIRAWSHDAEASRVFEVKKELVELANQLSDEDEFKRRTAALLLTEFGTPAIPVLVEALSFGDPAISTAVTSALVRIGRKQRDLSTNVTTTLGEHALDLFRRECVSPRPNQLQMVRSILGVAKVGETLAQCQLTRQYLDHAGKILSTCNIDPEDHRLMSSKLATSIEQLEGSCR